jgi:galactose mutarotase-like enzyme
MDRLVTLTDGDSRALIYPEQGFQLHGFDVGGTQVVYGPRGSREPADRRYGNPVLFPSVGLTTGTRANHWDREGQALLMGTHGWVRDLYWHVVDGDARSITAVVTPTMNARIAFPFDFEMKLRYSLAGAALTLDTTITNTGGVPFPYALGFHPYLRAPLGAAAGGPPGDRGRCIVKAPAGLRLKSADLWRTITRGREEARTLPANAEELAGSVVLAETGATALEVEDPSSGLAARVSVAGSEQSYPVWVIWSAAPDAAYVCLEPWTDAPNALNRPGTRTLPAGGKHRYRMALSVRKL